MKSLIVLPSYNESQNIVRLIDAILNLSNNYFIVLVDDNSPDRTFEIVKEYKSTLDAKMSDRLNLILRSSKDGRGGAVWEGLKWGIQNSNYNFECFIEMDCDYSHNPKYLACGINLINKQNDVVLASRYPDGQTIGWPLRRIILSFISNMICRIMIKWNIGDYTNGYRFYNKKSVKILLESNMIHKGYINLSESLAILMKHNSKVSSFPITFINRQEGKSNTDFRELLNSFIAIFQISFRFWFGRK
jgi:dolichol-phosphate mannosyltransferase